MAQGLVGSKNNLLLIDAGRVRVDGLGKRACCISDGHLNSTIDKK
jgi:hypothetical protein